MLVRDINSGRLVAVPDTRLGRVPLAHYGDTGFGSYGQAPDRVIYDGLGNPLGLPFLAALAPLASSLFPAIAGGAAKLLPMLTSALPSIAGGIGKILPGVAQALPGITQALPGLMTSMSNALPAMAGGFPAPTPMPSMPPAPQFPAYEAAMLPSPMPLPLPPERTQSTVPRDEVVVTPMRVQGPDGSTRIVPVRVRRRRRTRRSRSVRVGMPMAMPMPTPMTSAPRLAGYPGFYGWQGY